jgi:hypothetical protein
MAQLGPDFREVSSLPAASETVVLAMFTCVLSHQSAT